MRIGCVKYLNARPLIHGWPAPIEFDHPAALCRKLASGELDVALVSSFEFLRNPTYTIVDKVAIAADGPVYSVVIAHQGKLETIALDPASETSVNLLRCIRDARVVTPDERYDAQLLIGDQAIRFRAAHAHEYSFLDLAEEWKRITELPFVFALWLVRPGVPNARETAEQLRALRDANLRALDDVIAAQTEFPPEFCAGYYRENLRFEFGAREKQGLLHFHSLCVKHGILRPADVALRLI